MFLVRYSKPRCGYISLLYANSKRKKYLNLFVSSKKSRTFAPVKHRGVEQLVARWAHNPKVIRSSRISATY